VRLTSNGYEMPPTGPSVDGIDLPLPDADRPATKRK
jgi:hypothetical protein